MNAWKVGAAALPALLGATACSFGPALADDYVGPRATMVDTAVRKLPQLAWVFDVEQIDGRTIHSSRMETMKSTRFDESQITPAALSYAVPARPARFALSGGTVWGSALDAVYRPSCLVEGEVSFTPLEGHRYTVTGRIAQEACAVWIQDTATGEVMGRKVVGAGLR